MSREIIYDQGSQADESAIVLMVGKNPETPPFLISPLEMWQQHFQIMPDFLYKVNGKSYHMQGKLLNNNYLVSNGYSEQSREIIRFTKDPEQYKFQDSIRNCTRYFSAIPDKKVKIAVYTFEKNDGQDYRQAMKLLLQQFSVNGLMLAENQIVAALFFEKEDGSSFPLLNIRRFSETGQEFFADKKDMESVTKDSSATAQDDDMPIYCMVTSPVSDQDVEERLSDFYGSMCSYYDVYGKDRENFISAYRNEADFRIKFFQKNKTMNPKQIELYRQEIFGYKNAGLQ